MSEFLQHVIHICQQILKDIFGVGIRDVASQETECSNDPPHSRTQKQSALRDYTGQSFSETAPVSHRPTPEELLRQQIGIARTILNSVDGKTLDDQQMRCVIDSSPRQLVIAGAGTGKTTTIVGKILYLLKTGAVSANEIAVFSYTKPSAEDVRNRIQEATSRRIYAATFHSFAAKIIASVEGCPRRIADNATEQFISKIFALENLSEQDKQLLCKYVLYGSDNLRSECEFSSYSEYQDYLNRHLRIPLHGKTVDNFGSFFISNYLTIHGIDYAYYEKTDNFLLIGKNIFIQYNPWSENGHWPICYHKTLGPKYTALRDRRFSYQNANSRIIHCHSNQLSDGTMEAHLAKELSRYGIQPVLRPSGELWPLAFPPDGKELAKIRNTFNNIISLMHCNNYSVENVLAMANKAGIGHNNRHILQLIQSLYPAYRQYLAKNGLTTFDDLIITAIDYLKTGKYTNPFTYIIVDEYQDIAPSRVDFLQSLLEGSPSKLLCVGDDWQSIYGFNGSDVRFILKYEEFWGNATVNKIEKTYRFSQSLVDVLGEFVMANPNQVKKQIRGHNNLKGNALRVLFADNTNQILDIIAQTLDGFPIDSTVFFIGRFKKDWDNISKDCSYFETEIHSDTVSITYCRRTDLQIRFLTAHASKGLEADNVIIINAKNETFGFPSQIPIHPIVNLLQGQQNQYPYEEERRLFYVAATRTRNRTYIVCSKDNMSVFIDEIVM